MPGSKRALFWKSLRKGRVLCVLCPRYCVIKDGERGYCRARENRGGILYSVVYAKPCSVAVDPIEKKPLFHYRPGSKVLSVATAGCNLGCLFCQNADIAAGTVEELPHKELSPEELVSLAKKYDCEGLAYTYTEPTIFYEYAIDTAKVAKHEGLFNVFVTNGVISPEPLRKVSKYVDAANIDLKGFTEEYYRKVCDGKLEWVLDSIKQYNKLGVWVELTNLVVPSQGEFRGNDSVRAVKQMLKWVVDNVGPEVPFHFSRFFPIHKLSHVSATRTETLKNFRELALKAGLKHVYVGNVFDSAGLNNTVCPECGRTLLVREGNLVVKNNLVNGRCECGHPVAGVWE